MSLSSLRTELHSLRLVPTELGLIQRLCVVILWLFFFRFKIKLSGMTKPQLLNSGHSMTFKHHYLTLVEGLAGDVKQDLPITARRGAVCKLPILRRPPESYSILGLSEKNVMADSSMSETLKMVLTAGRIFQSDPCSALT